MALGQTQRRSVAVVVTPTLVALAWVVLAAAVVTAGARVGVAHEWLSVSALVPLCGSAAGTWAALVLITWRCGGRTILTAAAAGVLLTLVVVFPEPWVLAAAGVGAAASYGVLALLITRPAGLLGSLREVAVAVVCALAGAVCVHGYDVSVQPERFRAATLLMAGGSAFVLAARFCADGRRLGVFGIGAVVGVTVLVVACVGYVYALRQWGPDSVDAVMRDVTESARATLGAWPRPLEALVGFPALVFGVTMRRRRRVGWWMTAFATLAVGGVAARATRPDAAMESLLATGYSAGMGLLLAFACLVVIRVTAGPGRSRRRRRTAYVDPPEPGRMRPLA